MHILGIKKRNEYTYSVLLQCSSYAILLNGEIPMQGIPALYFITARVLNLYRADKHQTTFIGMEENSINMPPAYPIILPNCTLEMLYSAFSRLYMRKNTYTYAFLSFIFAASPDIKDLQTIYAALQVINAKESKYMVEGDQAYMYIGTNNITNSSEKIYLEFYRLLESDSHSEFNIEYSPAKNMEYKITEDIEKAVGDNYVILYLNSGYIKYFRYKRANLSHIYIDRRHECIKVRGKRNMKSILPNNSRRVGLSRFFHLYADEVVETLFGLMFVEILKNHNKELYSGIMPKESLNVLKIIDKTTFQIENITPVFKWYNSHKRGIMHSFICAVDVKKILNENNNRTNNITLNIYFVGEVITLHHYIKKLKKEALLYFIINSLLKERFETFSSDDKDHYIFLHVNGFEVKHISFHDGKELADQNSNR